MLCWRVWENLAVKDDYAYDSARRKNTHALCQRCLICVYMSSWSLCWCSLYYVCDPKHDESETLRTMSDSWNGWGSASSTWKSVSWQTHHRGQKCHEESRWESCLYIYMRLSNDIKNECGRKTCITTCMTVNASSTTKFMSCWAHIPVSPASKVTIRSSQALNGIAE